MNTRNWIKRNRINLLMLTAAGHIINIAWVVSSMKYGDGSWLVTLTQFSIMVILWYVLVKLEHLK